MRRCTDEVGVSRCLDLEKIDREAVEAKRREELEMKQVRPAVRHLLPCTECIEYPRTVNCSRQRRNVHTHALGCSCCFYRNGKPGENLPWTLPQKGTASRVRGGWRRKERETGRLSCRPLRKPARSFLRTNWPETQPCWTAPSRLQWRECLCLRCGRNCVRGRYWPPSGVS